MSSVIRARRASVAVVLALAQDARSAQEVTDSARAARTHAGAADEVFAELDLAEGRSVAGHEDRTTLPLHDGRECPAQSAALDGS